MDDTLSLLGKLRQTLSETAAAEDATKWWDIVERIEASFFSDPRHSREEQALVARIRSGVSDAIAARRDGLTPALSLALVPISALEGSVRRRTISKDGWPLR